MITCYVNGFIPPDLDNTKVVVFDWSTHGTENAIRLYEGSPDANGLVIFELSASLIDNYIQLVAIGSKQAILSTKLKVEAYGLFHTVSVRADNGRDFSNRDLGIPPEWYETSQRALDVLIRQRPNTPLENLRQWSGDSRVRFSHHFSAQWSAFNAWYNQTINLDGNLTDRDCIELLKNSSSEHTVYAQNGFDRLLKKYSPQKVIANSFDPMLEDHQLYWQSSEIIDFVQACFINPHLDGEFYLGEDLRVAPTSRYKLRDVGLVYCSEEDFRLLYRKVRIAQSNEKGIVESVYSLKKLLLNFGIAIAPAQ